MLTALTLSALALPGLHAPGASAAEEDGIDIQYSRYQEGRRNLKVRQPQPIEVDTLRGRARYTFKDRLRLMFDYTQDTWSGATPIATTVNILAAASPYFTLNGRANSENQSLITLDQQGGLHARQIDGKLDRLVHTMSFASPETRRQGSVQMSYEWDEFALTAGGGISHEHDYHSRFGNLGARFDFNQKRTTVNAGVSYTRSDTDALFNPDALNYLSQFNRRNGRFSNVSLKNFRIQGERKDWGFQLGLTQVLTRNALFNVGIGYTRSDGFLNNPYKAVTVFRFDATPEQLEDDRIESTVSSILEQRPDERHQITGSIGYRQYISPLDAALNFDYRYFHDDWGIRAHTLEARWLQPVGSNWIVTPHIRYYSQSSADFYRPYLLQGSVHTSRGRPVEHDLNRFNTLPEHFSSDHRLSGYGTLSGGVIISRQFMRGVHFETGFEYYTHQGALKLGKGGEQSFADFDFWIANAAFRITPGSTNLTGGRSEVDARGQADRETQAHVHPIFRAPAGVMFDHALPHAGDVMIGYRFLHGDQAGSLLNGTRRVSLDEVNRAACGGLECAVTTRAMNMNVHMLELMYAPAHWLTLMLMPQWMDMTMSMNINQNVKLGGGGHGSHGDTTGGNRHESGGIGDLGFYALLRIFETPRHQLTLSLGGTAPTGKVNIHLPKIIGRNTNQLIDYGMQLGSGTWDFKPALTLSGESGRLFWGAQAGGTVRLEKYNQSGFSLGDNFQGSAWGGYQWKDWLALTVRGLYTTEGRVTGKPQAIPVDFNGLPLQHYGPFNFPANYGGNFVDVGFGVNVTIPRGTFAGNNLKFEWLQPVHTDYNGYQPDRDGALRLTWQYGF